MLCPMVIVLNFWETIRLYPQHLYHFIFHQQSITVRLPSYPCQYLLLSIFLTLAVLVGVKWDIILICIHLFYFYLFRATSTAYGGSQSRGPIRAVTTSLCHSHSNARSEPRLQTTPQLTAMPAP